MYDPCRSKTYIKSPYKKKRMCIRNFKKFKGKFLDEQRPSNQKLNKYKRNTLHNIRN